MTTMLIVAVVLLTIALVGVIAASATWIRERDEWESFARSLQDELDVGPAVRRG